jgi:hypothetical protein
VLICHKPLLKTRILAINFTLIGVDMGVQEAVLYSNNNNQWWRDNGAIQPEQATVCCLERCSQREY